MKPFVISLLLLAVLIVPERLEAQALRSYGVKAAFTSAVTSYERDGSSRDHDRRSGVNVALFAEWQETSYLSVLVQMEYAQRGFVSAFQPGAPSRDDSEMGRGEEVMLGTRIDYLSALVPLKVRYPFGARLTPFVLAGPRIDVLLGQRAEAYEGAFGPARFKLRDLRRSQVGLSTGAGVTFGGLGKAALTIEARYNLDLTNASSTSEAEIKHNAFDVWFGIAL